MRNDLKVIGGPVDGPEIIIATMHGKEAVIAPMLMRQGFRVLHPVNYDTDALGTFTGDIPRYGTAFEAAIQKSKVACEIYGIARAISSEGTYRPSQTLFPGARNAEILAYVDAQAGVNIVEHQTDVPTQFFNGRVRPDVNAPEVQELLRNIGWPDIKVMVIPDDKVRQALAFKGIDDLAALAHALSICAKASGDGLAHLETDLRAHMNGTRMKAVAALAEHMAHRLALDVKPLPGRQVVYSEYLLGGLQLAA